VNGGSLPEWCPPFPGKMISAFTTIARLNVRMHSLEDWLSALLRHSKSVITHEAFEALLVRLLISFLNIKKTYEENKIEFSKPYKQTRNLSRSLSRSRSESKDYNLFSSVRSGELEDIQVLLENRVRANGADAVFREKDSKGETLLHIACAIDREDVVQLMINLGADVNCLSSEFEDTPLHFACFESNVNISKLLVNHGAKVDTANSSGKTPLHYACRYSFDLVKFFLEHGADYHAKNHDQQSALHISSAYCVDAAMYLLSIDKGLGINEKDAMGFTPLLSAVHGGSTTDCPNRLLLIEQLIKAHADIHATDGTGKNAALICCTTGDTELLKMFVGMGVSVHILDHQNRNALHIAIQSAQEGVLTYLLNEFGDGDGDGQLDLFHFDDSGENALHKAASVSNDAIFSMIWARYNTSGRKQDMDAPNGMGFTPLHFACMNAHREAAVALLEAGADGARINEVS
jgi:ankyrin repeat protein